MQGCILTKMKGAFLLRLRVYSYYDGRCLFAELSMCGIDHKKSCSDWNSFFIVLCFLLALDSSDTRKYLALDCLKQCTTTSRNVRYAVGQAELVYASYGITTTY